MKTLFKLSLYFLLLPVTIFSQNRISETNNSNFKGLKSIKSERTDWKDTSREKQFYKNNQLGTIFRLSRWTPPVQPRTSVLPQQMPRLSSAYSITSGVRYTVPGDFPTIQSAIDACSDGDTVLVSEGTYLENIRYRGKAIVVGSLYLIDGDTSHISKTIIDGSGSTQADSGSVVYFVNGEDTTSVLCGFTILGGSGTRSHWFGPRGSFWYRAGGGVFCDGAGARIVRNIITHNRVVAQVAMGGGIEALGTSSFLPFLILNANRIEDNYVQSDTIVEWGAFGGSGGADILMNARIVNNVFERDSIVSNSGAFGGGLALYSFDSAPQLPTAYIAGNVFRSNFASSSGVQNGTYGGGVALRGTGQVTVNDNLFESNVGSALGSQHQWVHGGGLNVDDEGIVGYGRKTITNNRFVNNRALSSTINFGGGLLIGFTKATISRNWFEGNYTSASTEYSNIRGGAGIKIHYSSFLLDNNIFTGNYSGTDGGAMTIAGNNNVVGAVINNTIVNNHAALSGGGLMAGGAYLVLLNNIFWNNTASSEFEIYNTNGSLGLVSHCDVQGGYPGPGNIDIDPAFVVDDTTFHLMANSPCIESGIDSIQFQTYDFLAPMNDFDGLARPMPAGTPLDMGAQEDQITTVAFAHDLTVTPLSLQKQLDTLHIQATVDNPYHHTLDVTAFIVDFASSNTLDSLSLFNDGLHGDGMANDTLWGGMLVPTTEGVYGVRIRTVDNQAGTYREPPLEVPSFTTAGPVRYMGYLYWGNSTDTIPAPGITLYVRIGLKNFGTIAPISNVTAHVSAIDPLKDYVSVQPSWGTLFPGDTIYYSKSFIILYIGYSRVLGDTASFALDIASNGFTFWRDTIRIVLEPTGVNEETIKPITFELEQNYPNPFNPSTTINYSIPKQSYVILKVYDIIGREVETLVNGEKPIGNYKVDFNAANLSSGVYFYQLRSGSFVQSKKMVLMK